MVLAAVVIHVFGLPVLEPTLGGGGKSAQKTRPVKVAQLSPAVREQLRRQRQVMQKQQALARRDPEKEREKKKKDDADPKGQVVDVPPMASDEAPEDARYLSEHNTKVERETRSRNQSQHYQNSMNERTVAKKGELAAPQEPSEAKALEIGPNVPSQDKKNQGQGQDTTFELPRVKARDRLALKLDPSLGRIKNQQETEAIDGTGDRLRLSLGDGEEQPETQGSAPSQGAPALELVPQVGVLARLSGAPANDHLEDLEEGEGTFLNSREFKYASFFNRMKRGVSQHWRAVDEYRRRDPSGNIYGFRSRITVLSVTLNPDGSLKNVEVQKSSGVDFLDREAMSAFQRAEPFPNPPKGLVGPSGEISFPFGFYIDFSPGLRMPF